MCHADRAYVCGDELPLQPEAPGQGCRLWAGHECLQIDSVSNHRNFSLWNSVGDENSLEGVGDAYDPCGPTIEPVFEPSQHAKQGPLAHRPHGHDRIGPQITELEYERPALHPGEDASTQRREDLGRRRHDHVGRGQEQSREDARDPETEIVQGSPEETFIGRHVSPDAHNADSVNRLALPELVPVPRKNPSRREVRYVGEHGHPVSRGNPIPRVLVSPGGRSVGLRRKVVGKEKDVHRTAILLRRSPPPRRWVAAPRFARPEPAARSTSRTPESTHLLPVSIAARPCRPCATGSPAEEGSSSRRSSLPRP